MPHYLIDTNTVSDMARNPQGRVIERLKSVGNNDIAVSIIVACELHFGLAKIGTGRLANNVRQILAELTVIPLSLLQELTLHPREGERRSPPIGLTLGKLRDRRKIGPS